MANKRSRHQNPEPFLPHDNGTVVSSKNSSKSKRHQTGKELISSRMTSKIFKEAAAQHKEIQQEEQQKLNPNNALSFVEEPPRPQEEEDDVDDFNGFDETHSQFGNYEEEINEHDEKILEAFLSKDATPQRTPALADLIIQKIKEKDATITSAGPLPKLDNSILDLYKGVGVFLSKYTTGKMPKAFKHIAAMQHWEKIMYLTEPEKWSPNAIFQATRIFASNLTSNKAERFYKLVVLPRVREDIRKNGRLHFALYQALKKSLYKPGAFYNGILLSLCESGTCTLREAVIVGSIIEKVSIPADHSGVALLKLAEMKYSGTTSYFIKLLLDKKYYLSYRVVDALVGHFMRFVDETGVMPVIWHQSLLSFVQRYKNELRKEDKLDQLRLLVENQKHYLVTPEITRELNNILNRGEKQDDLMLISTPISIINKTIEEDWSDIPDVPMDED